MDYRNDVDPSFEPVPNDVGGLVHMIREERNVESHLVATTQTMIPTYLTSTRSELSTVMKYYYRPSVTGTFWKMWDARPMGVFVLPRHNYLRLNPLPAPDVNVAYLPDVPDVG